MAESRPTLARLARNRIGFGPRPDDPDYGDDWDAFVAHVDQQLAFDSIDDAACIGFVQNIYRKDDKKRVMPPLDASIPTIRAYCAETKKTDDYGPWYLSMLLSKATYARALFSKRQLFEVMVDFWNNHFNTIADDEAKLWDDQHVIRTNALGNFRDLLGATAKSPTMLRYLSNAYSDGENPNENYAREIMELHTLGSTNKIPGHTRFGQPNYTEDDVHAVAQILSGRTVHEDTGEFRFIDEDGEGWPRHHRPAKSLQLDHASRDITFAEGGIEQSERLLDILASHASTAYFISWKLCKRLIADVPHVYCPGAVKAGAEAFRASNGDIRKTLRAVLLYREAGHDFASSWGQKVKRPFEFYISALRALNMRPDHAPKPLNGDDNPYDWEIEALGQRLFYWPPPTGFPDVKQVWWNSNQVFARWSLGNTLVRRYYGEQWSDDGSEPNAALDVLIGKTASTTPTAQKVLEQLTWIFWGGLHDDTTWTRLLKLLSDGDPNKPITSQHPRLRPLIGTLIAAPQFQWR